MTAKDIKKVFAIYEKDLLIFLLNKINFNDKEKEIIDNYYIKGNSINEDLALKLGISLKTLTNRYNKVKNKLERAWENDSIIKMILNR